MNYDDIGDSDDENTHDAYLEQMKAEGREKEEGEIDENEDSDPSSGNHIMICCEVSLMDSQARRKQFWIGGAKTLGGSRFFSVRGSSVA